MKTLDERVTDLEVRQALLERIVEQVAPSYRLVMSWPAGDIARRTLSPWFSAVNFAEEYNGGAYHSGADLNLPGYADSGAAVMACADGVVRFAGRVSDAWLSVVVIEHTLETGRKLWSRYAHINPVRFAVGCPIKRGDLVGNIADYGTPGKVGDHLHFDLAWVDLGSNPGDWPGNDKARVIRTYIDPILMILGRLP